MKSKIAWGSWLLCFDILEQIYKWLDSHILNFICKILKYNCFEVHCLCNWSQRKLLCAWPFTFALPQIYIDKKSHFNVERNTPKQLVEKVAEDIANLLKRKRKALEVSSTNNPSLPAGCWAVDNRGLKLLSVTLKRGIDPLSLSIIKKLDF